MHHVLASALVGLAVWAAPYSQAAQADFDAQSITVIPGIPEVIPSTSPPPEVPAQPIPAPTPRAIPAEPPVPEEGPVRTEASPPPAPVVQEVQAQPAPAPPAAAPAPVPTQAQAPAPAAGQPSLRSEPRPTGGKRVAAFWMMLPGRS